MCALLWTDRLGKEYLLWQHVHSGCGLCVYYQQQRIWKSIHSEKFYKRVRKSSTHTCTSRNQDCFDAISKAICIHYFLPCGSNGSLHVPQFVCQDVCSYIEDEVCRNEWPLLVEQLKTRLPPERAIPHALPICNNTSEIIAPLNLTNDCCNNAGIVVPSKIQLSTLSLTISSPTLRTPSATLDTTITITSSSVATSIVLLVGISSACLLLLLLWWKKRKSINKEVVSKSERYIFQFSWKRLISDHNIPQALGWFYHSHFANKTDWDLGKRWTKWCYNYLDHSLIIH